MKRAPDDLLGAHVSTQGGVAEAPARGNAIGASAIQVFTKTPNQWRESMVRDADVAAFRAALAASGIRAVVSHDSYLINLASPDQPLRERSIAAFSGELVRCRALGIPWVVSHPGNYIDDRAEGLARNARAYAQCLTAVAGEVGVLLEGTAGAGTALGSTFEELRALRDALPPGLQRRVEFCLDTAHLHAAGYGSTGRSASRISNACTSTTPRVRPARTSTATSGSAKGRSARSRSGASCATRGSLP